MFSAFPNKLIRILLPSPHRSNTYLMKTFLKRRLFFSFSIVFVFCSVFSCTLQIDKIDQGEVNDQHYVFGRKVGSWLNDTVFRFCCNGSISTHSSEFDKGKYEVLIMAKGTQAYNTYPHIQVTLNDKALKTIELDSNYTTYNIPFSLTEKQDIGIQILFDQDGLDSLGNDRDVLIRKIRVDSVGN
jgi:hypothetical protein